MFTANTEYESQGRQFTATLVAGSQSINAKYISSFNISESISANNTITMGTVNSSKLELNLVQLTPTIAQYFYKGVRIKVSLTVTDTTLETPTSRTDVLGYYYIDEIDFGEYHTDNLQTAKITAYDGFSKTEKPFTYSGSQNPSIRTLIASIASSCGIDYVSSHWSNSINVSSYPEDATCRTMIGYLASLQGTVAYFTRDNKLGAKWYLSTAKTITRAEQYADKLNIGKSSDSNDTSVVTIKYIESGTSEATLAYPSNGVVGQSISFENPLIANTEGSSFGTQRLQAIYTDKICANPSASSPTYMISFTPLEVSWRGNATIECGEIVTVKDRNDNNLTCYIMEREMSFDGGFSETYKCYGENEKTVSFSTNPAMQKLNRRLSALEEEIETGTSVISQTAGSVFELIDAQDPSNPTKNAGWKLYNTNNDNYILATSNGIGFSSNGGQSFTTGIYIDPQTGGGHIYGQCIVANSITTDQINFTDATVGMDAKISAELASGAILIGNGKITGTSDTLANILSALDTEAGNAASAAATANATIASWATGTGNTYINGAMIATGTITAEQVNIGWQAGNLASSSKWSNPGYTDSEYLVVSVDDEGNVKCDVAKNFTSATKTIYSAPFYMAKGAKLKMSAAFSISGGTGATCQIRLQSSSTINGTYSNVSQAYISENFPTLDFLIDTSQYYRLSIQAYYLNASSSITNLYATYTVTGTMVVTGSIKSNDNKTYFDLDNSEFVTDNGATKTRLSNGALEFYMPDKNSSTHKLRGMLVGTGFTESGTTHYSLGLYYEDGNATSISLGKRSGSSFYDAMEVFYNNGNSYARVWADFGGFETVNPYGYKGKMGIGSATYSGTSYTSASIQVLNGSTTMARLDCIGFGNGAGAIRCQNGSSSTSPWLVLDSSSLSYNGKTVVTSDNVDSYAVTTNSDGSNLWLGGYKMASGGNFDDFMSARVSHIKISVGGTVYTAYWS